MSEAFDGVTGISTLNDLLDNYRVPAGSRATLLEAVAAVQADGVDIVGRIVGADVELVPVDGTVGAVVGPNRLSLAMERRAAVRAAQQHEFCRVEDETEPGRVQLVMEQWAVQQHAVVVRNLAVAALRGAVPRPVPAGPGRQVAGARASRPARTGRTAKASAAAAPPPPPKPAMCPIHFTQLINGTCDYCDA